MELNYHPDVIIGIKWVSS